MQPTVILSSLCEWKHPKWLFFVVKRYAVRKAKKWRYAVRKAKIGRYKQPAFLPDTCLMYNVNGPVIMVVCKIASPDRTLTCWPTLIKRVTVKKKPTENRRVNH